jgi:hypothetical protein
MRKLVAAIPTYLPEEHREKALAQIHNDKTRARVRARIETRRAVFNARANSWE